MEQQALLSKVLNSQPSFKPHMAQFVSLSLQSKVNVWFTKIAIKLTILYSFSIQTIKLYFDLISVLF